MYIPLQNYTDIYEKKGFSQNPHTGHKQLHCSSGIWMDEFNHGGSCWTEPIIDAIKNCKRTPSTSLPHPFGSSGLRWRYFLQIVGASATAAQIRARRNSGAQKPDTHLLKHSHFLLIHKKRRNCIAPWTNPAALLIKRIEKGRAWDLKSADQDILKKSKKNPRGKKSTRKIWIFLLVFRRRESSCHFHLYLKAIEKTKTAWGSKARPSKTISELAWKLKI